MADMKTPAGHTVVLEELSLQWVIRQLMEDGQWYWLHLMGQETFLSGLLEMIRKHCMEEYMAIREKTLTVYTKDGQAESSHSRQGALQKLV